MSTSTSSNGCNGGTRRVTADGAAVFLEGVGCCLLGLSSLGIMLAAVVSHGLRKQDESSASYRCVRVIFLKNR
jgi:hypothetical protein